MTRSRKKPERVDGGYVAMPWVVLDSAAYRGCSLAAKCLLFEIARQHNGANNGHLQASQRWLKGRGWKSTSTIHRARKQLESRGLIVCTRQGGFGIGPSRYALTWLNIHNFVGLEVKVDRYHQGAWAQFSEPILGIYKSPRGNRTDPLGDTYLSNTDPP